MSAEYDSFVDL